MGYKRAVLIMFDAYLVELLKHASIRGQYTYQVISNAIPDDAKVVRTFQVDEWQGALGILLESESFEEVPKGTKYPILPAPIFRMTMKEMEA